uniref:Activating signal cointegrator 1 n=1 Tax=Schistocephalus solidus TaxID=70667 RepID=A0A0X3P852_SCHSO
MPEKAKKKFVPLFHEGGTITDRMVVLLPGRHPCQCLAVRHQLVGNCTSCGRIVCEQEGPGSCFFCGAMVLTPEQHQLLQSGTNAARKLLNRLHSTPWAPGTPTPPCAGKPRVRHRRGGGGVGRDATSCHNGKEPGIKEPQKELEELDDETDYEDEFLLQNLDHGVDAQKRLEDGLVKAVLQRDRLLHFDATTAQRTRVIDDELDYFVGEGSGAAAAWLDPETRARVAKRVEELRAQRHASRLDSSRLCIDFANKLVFEEDTRGEAARKLYSAEMDVLSQKLDGVKTSSATSFSTVPLSDPLLDFPTPQFVSDLGPENQRPEAADSESRMAQRRKRGANGQSTPGRVQDSEQNRLIDNGFCLSMHQPWASLLVRGIKRDEGRTWYSAHRGPLWIAAAAKVPEDFEIRAVEEECIGHGAQRSDFPKSYPTGCLLGRVNVDDVLPQSEYRSRFPNGPSTSPFVFVCSDPRELLMKLPMQGAHKIYKLDPLIHTSAKANLA